MYLNHIKNININAKQYFKKYNYKLFMQKKIILRYLI